MLAAAVLVGQASVGWSNDAIDAPIDRRAGRTDKPIPTGTVREELVRRAAAAALLLCVPLSLAVGWRAGAAHLVAVGLAWLYNLRLKSTIASVASYAGAFSLVPVVVAGALPSSPLPRPTLVAAAGCCGIAAHFANTVGDSADDAATGVRGLPQRVGVVASVLTASVFVALAGVLVLIGVGATVFTVAAVLVAGGAALAMPVLLRRVRTRHAAFQLVLAAVAVLIVGFVVSGGAHLTTSAQ